MLQAPKSFDEVFEEYLQDLPLDYREMAIEFKAFVKPRKIKNPTDLLLLVFIFCGADKALRDVAGNFTLLRERISDTAVQKRLQACVPWVKALLQKLWPGIDKVQNALRLIVIDGSSVSVPGANGTSYRLHLAINLFDLSFIHVEVTDPSTGSGHRKSVGESLSLYPLTKGDVVLLDRGYNHPRVILNHHDKDVQVILRLNPYSMPLFEADGETKLNLYDTLKKAKSHELCIPVQLIKNGKVVAAYVHARRLPEDKIPEARRKCKARAKNKQPKEETLLYAEWVLIFTTVEPVVLDTETICSLYGLRWQVELVIKRLKSLLDIDKLRAKEKSLLNDIWLYGKLLFATLISKRADKVFGMDNLEVERHRQITPWRIWKILKDEAITKIIGVLFWKPEQFQAALIVMRERPRKRKLKTLPLSMSQLEALFCQ